MLKIEKVISYFSLFTDLTNDSLEQYHGICEAALNKISRRINPKFGIITGEDNDALCIAAAGEAFLVYSMITSSADSEEIKVGDISLKSSSTNNSTAVEIRDSLLANVAHLLLPATRVLIGVEI